MQLLILLSEEDTVELHLTACWLSGSPIIRIFLSRI